MKVKVDYRSILRRQLSLSESGNEKISATTVANLYHRVKDSGNRSDILRFIKEVSEFHNKKGKETFYFNLVMEAIQMRPIDNEIREAFLEMVSKTNNVNIEYIVENSKLGKDIKKATREQVIRNKVADRILENHTRINSKCNLDEFISENRYVDSSIIIDKCIRTVDSCNMRLYGKINAAIEESVYLLQKNEIAYNEKKMINSILEYFLVGDDVSSEDKDNAVKVVRTNYCIDTNENVFENDIIKEFILYDNKNESSLSAMVTTFMNQPMYVICRQFKELLNALRYICMKSSLSDFVIKEVIPSALSKKIDEVINDDTYWDVARSFLSPIKADIDAEIDMVAQYISKLDEDVANRLISYSKALDDLNAKITEDLNLLYSKDNINNANPSITMESADSITLNEYKIFKFNNLINNFMKVDKYVQKKLIGVTDKAKEKFKDVKSEIFDEMTVYDVVRPDGSIDVCIASMKLEDCENTSGYHVVLTDLCNEVNSQFKHLGDIKSYYMIHPGYAEIYLRENINIVLNNKDREILNNRIPVNEAGVIREAMVLDGILEGVKIDHNIIETARKVFSKNPDHELFNLFVEAASIAGIEKEYIDRLFESTLNGSLTESTTFLNSNITDIDNYVAEETTLENVVIGYALMQAILEDAKRKDLDGKDDSRLSNVKAKLNKIKNKLDLRDLGKEDDKNDEDEDSEDEEENYDEEDSDENEDNDEDDEGNKKSKSSEDDEEAQKKNAEKIKASKEQDISKLEKFSNNVKLYIQGLKKKVKDLSAKEQEISRNADAVFNNTIRHLKSAVVSDRREAIIKGSVIPSFSKSCKLLIALAGISAVTNPGVAIIAAIGGLAASKRITKKERALLLDEIEVELQTIEKEISLAESNNQLKKMRQLMLIKKNLQREYQRIKLNVRVGKDLRPGATGGRFEHN